MVDTLQQFVSHYARTLSIDERGRVENVTHKALTVTKKLAMDKIS